MTGPAAILLAAGVGSRLRPITDDRPKCLVGLADGETIFARAARLLHARGWRRFVVATGYMAGAVEAAARALPGTFAFAHNAAFATTQNAVSLDLALRLLPAGTPFVKLDGDVVFDAGIRGMDAGAAGSAVLTDVTQPVRPEAMKVRLDGDRIVEFGKGIDIARASGESIGIERFSATDGDAMRDAIGRAIEAGRTDVYYEDIYNDALGTLDLRAARVTPDDWGEVDDHIDLAAVRARFARR